MTANRQVIALSSPVEDEPSLDAARSLLAQPDLPGAIDRIYGPLLDQRTLLTAIAHLERAGADLERLTVSSDLFKRAWPLNCLFPTPSGASQERISLSSIRASLDTHRGLLQDLTANVVDFADGSLLLFGRALAAAYPSYRHRMDYDLDLFEPEIDSGVRLLSRLNQELGFLLNSGKVCRLAGRWLLRLGVDAPSREKHLLHIDLIVGGWPAGPGTLLPPSSLVRVALRARRVDWAGRRVRVPAAEDMLLMLGAKISRHLASPLVVPAGGLIRKDFNDARILLSAEQSNLDWDWIVCSASSLGCTGVLYDLIRDAERQAGRPLAPADSTARLAPGAIERRFLRAAALTMEERSAAPGTRPPRWCRLLLRLWPSFSLLRRVAAPLRGPGSAHAAVADRLAELLFRLERRWKRSTRRYLNAMVPSLRKLRPGFGSLCELAAGDMAAGRRSCLSHSARSRNTFSLDPEAARVLRTVGAMIPAEATLAEIRARVGAHLDWKFVHHCDRLLFSVRPTRFRDPQETRGAGTMRSGRE